VTADPVDQILAQWRRERPDLDPSPMAVIGRLSRVSRAVERRLEEVFARHGLQSWGFDMLATLRRSGPPFEMTPTELVDSLMVSTSAMTNRIDRLAAAGYLQRRPDPRDRRAVQIRLTPAGRQLIDQVLVEHLDNERTIVEALTPAEQDQLAALLRRLGAALHAAPPTRAR
jgi:DNA-binding MarR family transcriptional regulator